MKAETWHLALNWLLAMACTGLILVIGWRLLLDEPVEVQPAVQLVQAAPTGTVNYSWRWFGYAEGDASSVDQAPAEEVFAEANINAVLIGVMQTPEVSIATISVNGQAEKVFSIGDELQSGVELISVSTSRIVLNERGRRVQVTMRRPEGMPAQTAVTTAVSNQPAAALESGFSLANMFDAVPVQLENSGTGFQLGGISQEMLDLTEIEEGDVVVQVGGMSIDQLMANPGQWMNFSTETTLPVTVMRNGEETTLYVNAFSLSTRILPGLTNESMQ